MQSEGKERRARRFKKFASNIARRATPSRIVTPRPGTTSSASEDSDNHLTVGWEEDHLNYKRAFTYSTFGRAQSKSSQVMGFVVGQLHCI
jgi:hypothetical protein